MINQVVHFWRASIGVLILAGLSGLSVACRPDSTAVQLPVLTPTDSGAIGVPTLTPLSATPTPMPPTSTPQATPTLQPTPGPITLTLVYDNRSYDARLATDWGLASVIEDGATTILFDTGGSGPILLDNLNILKIDISRVDAIVLSHSHSDHTGGLPAILSAMTITVYAPAAVIRTLPLTLRERAKLIETDQPTAITARLRTSGALGDSIVEQALVIKTEHGLSVLTGCAHPGIVNIVRQVREQGPVDLVIGGFHLLDASPAEVASVIQDLQTLGVRRVAPTHCTGEPAIAQFRAAFDDNFIEAGAGAVIVLAP